jgi:uncharacterized protein YjbJ (UPF0337 family)
MNWDQVEGKWKQYKGKVKEHWGKLTDGDVDVINGKRDQLVGKLQERYGIAKEAAQEQLDKFLKGLKETHEQAQAESDVREEQKKAKRAAS